MTSGFVVAGPPLPGQPYSMTSVGLDVGSSTTQLAMVRLELSEQGGRPVVLDRRVLHRSGIMTPFVDDAEIDGPALDSYVREEYETAGLNPSSVDIGALILTGLAMRPANAQHIAEALARNAGEFITATAGDRFEALIAGHGSGAAAMSEEIGAVLNIDVGGGTTKATLCRQGRPVDCMAMDVGARLVRLGESGVVLGLEPPVSGLADRAGISLEVGRVADEEDLRAVAAVMVDELMGELGPDRGKSTLLRTAPLESHGAVAAVTISGGVAEYVHGRSTQGHGDLGMYLAQAILERGGDLGAPIVETTTGIQATVLGAALSVVQLSGNTVFVDPPTVLPLRNLPVAVPRYAKESDRTDPVRVAEAVGAAIEQIGQPEADGPVAIMAGLPDEVSYRAIDAFCRGLVSALRLHLLRGHPVVVVLGEDVAGLIGIHLHDELKLSAPIVTIDGLELTELDFVDIGARNSSTGVIPVAVKSFVLMGEGMPTS